MNVENKTTSIEHIIAKIDNDFNPDNTDWIPRVAAWTIEALQQLKCLRTTRKRLLVNVNNRIARTVCCLDKRNIRVYDSKGCEINELKQGERFDCGCPSTGNDDQSNTENIEVSNTISLNNSETKGSDSSIVFNRQAKDYPARYNVEDIYYSRKNIDRKYLLIDKNTIQLNFDTDKIFVEYDSIETYVSNIYSIELPVIPNNALVIEAITYYCIYKMLCRGYKHPVMNLQASQYGTNPYYMWINLKNKANIDYIISEQSDKDIDNASKMFRSNFYINGFDPRR